MTYAETDDAGARPLRVNARFAADELETIRAAAACAGLTPTRYLAEAGLYLAYTHTTHHLDPVRRLRGELADVVDELHAVGRELVDARTAGLPEAQLREVFARLRQALDEVHAAAAALRTAPPLSRSTGQHPRNRPMLLG
jgi:hypothetical protein